MGWLVEMGKRPGAGRSLDSCGRFLGVEILDTVPVVYKTWLSLQAHVRKLLALCMRMVTIELASRRSSLYEMQVVLCFFE